MFLEISEPFDYIVKILTAEHYCMNFDDAAAVVALKKFGFVAACFDCQRILLDLDRSGRAWRPVDLGILLF